MVSHVHQYGGVHQRFHWGIGVHGVLNLTNVLALDHTLKIALEWVETFGQRTHPEHSFQNHSVCVVLSEVTDHVNGGHAEGGNDLPIRQLKPDLVQVVNSLCTTLRDLGDLIHYRAGFNHTRPPRRSTSRTIACAIGLCSIGTSEAF
ncbi:hypothetical protein D3C80_1116310 [compost metagenome]